MELLPNFIYKKILPFLDSTSTDIRFIASIMLSSILHIFLFLLLIFEPASAFLSQGTSGKGIADGAGIMLSLTPVKQVQNPAPSLRPDEKPQPLVEVEVVEETEALVKKTIQPEASELTSDGAFDTTKTANSISAKPLEEGISGSGATGANEKADVDLWNAIAPCWNQISDDQTLAVTLTVNFSSAGSLDTPPVIERDPSAPITDQSLRSEAKALAALVECGVYPMAKGLKSVTVAFPAPSKDGSQGIVEVSNY